MNPIEEIKKEIQEKADINWCKDYTVYPPITRKAMDLRDIFEILDKYKNQSAIKSDTEIYEEFCKNNGIITLKQIEDNQPYYKCIFNEIERILVMDKDEITIEDINELKKQYNLGDK